jgi:hypothetical protein
MDWTNEPATWRQIKSLKELGHTLNHRLTKVEAADLIRSLGGKPEGECSLVSKMMSDADTSTAYDLRVKAEKARQAAAEAGKQKSEKLEHELTAAISQRHDFWIDTCRGTVTSTIASTQVHELYQTCGCRFAAPSRKDVEYILDALDAALPLWDRDHPELFYQTLELNFPALLRVPGSHVDAQ